MTQQTLSTASRSIRAAAPYMHARRRRRPEGQIKAMLDFDILAATLLIVLKLFVVLATLVREPFCYIWFPGTGNAN